MSPLRYFLLAALLVTTPAWGVNPPGGTPTDTPNDCEKNGTGGSGAPSGGSIRWDISVGLARYAKPSSLSELGHSAFESSGNLPTFKQIYDRYFSSDPLQQKQVILRLSQPRVSSATLHPSCLFLQSEAIYETLRKTAANGTEYIHQILTDDAFTLIEQLTPPETGWRLRVWKRDASVLSKSGGYYVTAGFTSQSVYPLTDVTFKDPATGNPEDKLLYIQVERTGSGTRIITSKISEETDNDGNQVDFFRLYSGEGATGNPLSEEKLTYIRIPGAKQWDYTVIREVRTASTQGDLVLTAKSLENYDDFSTSSETGGEQGMKRLVQKIDAYDISGQSEQTTTYEYYMDTENPAKHGRLKSTNHPDGSWNFHEYNVSLENPVSIIAEYSGWKDLKLDEREQAKKTVTTVTASDSTVESFVAGQLVSISQSTLIPGEEENLTITKNWTGTGDPTNPDSWQVTTTSYYPESLDPLDPLDPAPNPSTGRIKWVEKSDGTASTYSYSSAGGYLTTVTRSGAGSRSGVTKGTQIDTTYRIGNFPTAQATYHIKSQNEIEAIESWTADEFDPLGRPVKRIYNDVAADYDETKYACCGLDEFRARDGSIIKYSRDYLKRVYQTDFRATADSPVITTSTNYEVNLLTPNHGLTTTRTSTSNVPGSATLFLGSTSRSLDGLTTITVEPSRKSNAEELEFDPEADRVTTTTFTAHSATGDIVTTTHADTSTTITAHYLDGQIKSVSGSAVPDAQYDYGTFSEGSGGLTSKVTSSGVSTETFTDPLGRTTKTVSPATGTTNYAYYPADAGAGSRGKLQSVTDGDGVTVTYGYNGEGERTTTSRSIPIAGNATATQVTTVGNDVVSGINPHNEDFGVSLHHTQTVSSTDFDPIIVSESYRSIDGLKSAIVTPSGSTVTTTTRPNSSGVATRTTIHPDGTKTVETLTHGLTTRVENQDSSTAHNVISHVDYDYDAHQRLKTVTDSRTGTAGTTTYSNFTESGQPLTTTQGSTPNIRVTHLAKDILGRTIATTLPNNSVAYTSYWPTGQIRAQWGTQTNPVFHVYDEQNRLIELHTWQTAPALDLTTDEAPDGSAKTEWIYSATTGLLVEKNHPGETDNGTTDADYTYTNGGRLYTRTWERGITTTYGYTHGLLTSTNYSDSTPDVAITYDALGRKQSVSNGLANSTFDYDDETDLGIDTETITYTLPGQSSFERVLDRHARSYSRDTGWDLIDDADSENIITENAVSYGYDVAGRLKYVHPAAALPAIPEESDFSYGYTPNSSLIATVTGPAHTVTNTWEPTRDVLKTKLNKETVGTASYPSSFGYTVNALGQRETVGPVLDENDAPVSTYSVSWGWDYNDRGELQSADHGDDATPNTHDRFYAFDAIGNRDYVRTGVYADSGGTQLDYIANDLNQYTVANGVSLPTSPGPAPHDLDGNLRFDGGVNKDNEAREYLWDAENRLTAVKRVSDSATVVSFLYDAQSRRIAKMAGTTATLYVYDSFNCIAEYSISNNQYSISRARTWGMDLSGSLQGAGGVGGLLAEKQGANSFYPTYDGNGNVSEYLAADGTVAAHFEYDPFGNIVKDSYSTGFNATSFTYKFSTKPLDAETGLYYYQYRYYDPVTGRWPSRDPIEERGGINLYGMVLNNPIYLADLLGLSMHPAATMGEIRGLWEAGWTAQQIAEALSGAASLAAIQAAIAELEAENVKKRDCQDKYKKYKDAQNQQRNNPYGKAKCCADAIAARDALQNEVERRRDYINSGCDKVIPTRADHPGELAAKERALEKAKEKVNELCK
jgi:RHS repeat-associated protein